MAKKLFGVDIDLALNQILRFCLENRTAHPTTGKAGRVYWNSTNNRITWHDGTQWVDMLSYFQQSTARHYQFFAPGNDLSLTITTAPSTLPTDNNLITVYAQGNRLFPDQGNVVLDWSRDSFTTPHLITLADRQGEYIMVEW